MIWHPASRRASRKPMSNDQPYAAPPIFDAIVELRLSSPMQARTQKAISTALAKNYDNISENGEVQVQVRIENGDVKSSLSPATPVYSLSSDDQTDQCRIESAKLHWSKLPPYTGWNDFRDRISRDLTSVYRRLKSVKIDRIGVRYRNRIDVPADENGICHYEDYLLTSIKLPGILDPHDGYEWRVTKNFAESGLSVTVMSGIMAPEIPYTNAFLLDVDASCSPEQAMRIEALLEKLDELRRLKNAIFEACITDKARECFQ